MSSFQLISKAGCHSFMGDFSNNIFHILEYAVSQTKNCNLETIRVHIQQRYVPVYVKVVFLFFKFLDFFMAKFDRFINQLTWWRYSSCICGYSWTFNFIILGSQFIFLKQISYIYFRISRQLPCDAFLHYLLGIVLRDQVAFLKNIVMFAVLRILVNFIFTFERLSCFHCCLFGFCTFLKLTDASYQGHTANARKHLVNAVKKEPLLWSAWVALASLCKDKTDFNTVIDCFEKHGTPWCMNEKKILIILELICFITERDWCRKIFAICRNLIELPSSCLYSRCIFLPTISPKKLLLLFSIFSNDLLVILS